MISNYLNTSVNYLHHSFESLIDNKEANQKVFAIAIYIMQYVLKLLKNKVSQTSTQSQINIKNHCPL
jgi:hypothetical protein